jgi:hypothetical protein
MFIETSLNFDYGNKTPPRLKRYPNASGNLAYYRFLDTRAPAMIELNPKAEGKMFERIGCGLREAPILERTSAGAMHVQSVTHMAPRVCVVVRALQRVNSRPFVQNRLVHL